MADIAYEVLLETGIRVQPLPRSEKRNGRARRPPTPIHACYNIDHEGTSAVMAPDLMAKAARAVTSARLLLMAGAVREQARSYRRLEVAGAGN